MKVVVVAGGWSVSQAGFPLSLLRDYSDYLIGVNESALRMPADVGVTMDRLWIENRREDIVKAGLAVMYRKGIMKNALPPPNSTPFNNNNRPGEMSETLGTLNGDNSGACALNLAFQWIRTEHLTWAHKHQLYLFGFDMMRGPKGERHWHPPYPWAVDEKTGEEKGTSSGRFEEWSSGFPIAAKQFEAFDIEVFNVTCRSKLKCFKTMSFEQFQKEMQ